MTPFRSIFLCLLTILPVSAFSQKLTDSHATRYPNLLITPDHGILSSDDLAYDEKLGGPADPYDPKLNSNQRYWQCLPIKSVQPKYHTWRGEDGMGYSGIEVTLCDLEIHVRSSAELQIFHDRRGHPVEFCNSFKKNWSRLTKKEDFLCLEGEGSRNYEDKMNGKYRLWTWTKLKTKKGCYAFFEGECHVAGCAYGKCPE